MRSGWCSQTSCREGWSTERCSRDREPYRCHYFEQLKTFSLPQWVDWWQREGPPFGTGDTLRRSGGLQCSPECWLNLYLLGRPLSPGFTKLCWARIARTCQALRLPPRSTLFSKSILHPLPAPTFISHVPTLCEKSHVPYEQNMLTCSGSL